jgi:hypothetical protein
MIPLFLVTRCALLANPATPLPRIHGLGRAGTATVASETCHGKRHRFVQALGGDLYRVLDSLNVAVADPAQRHEASVGDSPLIRLNYVHLGYRTANAYVTIWCRAAPFGGDALVKEPSPVPFPHPQSARRLEVPQRCLATLVAGLSGDGLLLIAPTRESPH